MSKPQAVITEKFISRSGRVIKQFKIWKINIMIYTDARRVPAPKSGGEESDE